MQTYFISDGTLVKIGKSQNPTRRLSGFQTAHSKTLKLLLVLPHDREKEFHTRFKPNHVRGEWFELSYDIRKFLAEQSGELLRMPFSVWLAAQKTKQTDIGRLAVIVAADRQFPKNSNQLQVFQRYYWSRPLFKKCIERAHKKWRKECQKDVNGKVSRAWT